MDRPEEWDISILKIARNLRLYVAGIGILFVSFPLLAAGGPIVPVVGFGVFVTGAGVIAWAVANTASGGEFSLIRAVGRTSYRFESGISRSISRHRAALPELPGGHYHRMAVVGACVVVVLTALGTNVVAADSDSVPEIQEVVDGTDPLSPDTDGDGLRDGAEKERGTDPTGADTDGDGLGDGEEVSFGSDPLAADTDDDGLSDSGERNAEADPTSPDTDGDELPDGSEVDIGTDPDDRDTDGDGYSDGYEVDIDTDPLVADQDLDGLSDRRERELGTSPTNEDTDQDGLQDAEEIEVGTDPLEEDTDGDLLLDGWEVHGAASNDDTGSTDTEDGLMDSGGDSRNGERSRYPDSDPLTKDLYLHLYYGADSKRLTSQEKDDIRTAFSEMPIENPGGETGIRVHINDEGDDAGRLQSEHHVQDRDDAFELFNELRYNSSKLPTKQVYKSLIVRIDRFADFSAIGHTPGFYSAVDQGATRKYGGAVTYRTRAAIHELLHNIVGELDPKNRSPEDDGHSSNGWLSYSDDLAEHEYLPEGIADEIERDGFVSDQPRFVRSGVNETAR